MGYRYRVLDGHYLPDIAQVNRARSKTVCRSHSLVLLQLSEIFKFAPVEYTILVIGISSADLSVDSGIILDSQLAHTVWPMPDRL